MTAATGLQEEKLLLTQESKDDLIEEILHLRRENETLKKQNEELKQKLEAPLQGMAALKRKLKKRWKKLGRPVGHPGITRHKPEFIHHTIHQTLERCPDCGQETLTELPSELEEHVQEDIVPAKVEATQFIRHGYWCSNCKQKKRAPYALEEVPYGYLGPNVLIQTILLKYHHGLPYSKIQTLFKELCGLKVTDSALAQALQRLAKWLKVEEELILKAIRKAAWVHGDETGWKIAGILHWFWVFVNQKLALYRIRRSRGRKVPKEILTPDFQGITVSDFLAAYDRTGQRRQRCLVHLEREIKNIRDPSPEYQMARIKLRRILSDAYRLKEIRGRLAPWVFHRRAGLLKERLLNFACHPFSNPHWKRLSKRLLKYYREILTFLDVPGLPSDNNLAERMIRPNVIFRKISFQNMSSKGAEAHETLMSLLQTLRLQDRNITHFFKTAYLRHRQGNPVPILSL